MALSEKQTLAVEVLARGDTRSEAARIAKTSRRTLYRWLDTADFRQAIAAERGRLLSKASGILAHGAARAARYLCDVADGQARIDARRIMACRWVLSNAVALGDLIDIAERLSMLEDWREETQDNGATS